MIYEFIKNYDENIYDNFVSLTNNIINKDKNIDAMFRITAESIFAFINENNNLIENTGNLKYNDYISNIAFKEYLNSFLNVDKKNMSILYSIKEDGNNAIHNNINKVFDYGKCKNRYLVLIKLLYSLIGVLIIEENKRSIKNSEINDEFDKIYNQNATSINENVNTRNIFNKKENSNFEIQKNEILKMDKEIENMYSQILDNENIKFDTNLINKIYELVYFVLLNVANKENFNDLEELKYNEYSTLYILNKHLENYKDVNMTIEEFSQIKYNLIDKIMDVNALLKRKYNFEILKYLFNTINTQNNKVNQSFYEKIAFKIEDVFSREEITKFEKGRFYVRKNKPFVVNSKVYYEIELIPAINKENKTNRVIVYSKYKIMDNYSIRLSLISTKIKFEEINKDVEVNFINSWEISIRPCEIDKYIKIFTNRQFVNTKTNNNFYKKIMNYLNICKCNLLDIILDNNTVFNSFIEEIRTKEETCAYFIYALKKAREIIINDEKETGANVLRYLFFCGNNKLMIEQISKKTLTTNKDLFLTNGVLQFDRNPLSYNLCKSKTPYDNVLKCIDLKDKESQMLVHKIDNLSIKNQSVFVSLDEIKEFSNIENLVNKYNKNLYKESDKIIIEDNYIYKKYSFDTLKNIVYSFNYSINENDRKLYNESLNEALIENENNFDSQEKIEILKKSFQKSKYMFIYGKAGSGKTELICNYYMNVFKNMKVLYITNTHSTLQGLKRRIINRFGNDILENVAFKVAKSADKEIVNNSYDVIIMDECKTISNMQMEKIINVSKYVKYVVMAGDIGQINSIDLGNWFEVAKEYLSEDCQGELTKNYRIKDDIILTLSNKVLNRDENVINYINENKLSNDINMSIFNKENDDEIILCLNYSGIYGINSINKYFQMNNPNVEYKWGINIYKVGDPIVFNESANERFDKNIIYNNLKGIIKNIELSENEICFILKIENYINEEDIKDIEDDNIELLGNNEEENSSIIKIKIRENIETDGDENDDKVIVPFDVTYAMSIHKAQGLEYNSVKLIITPESEEIINNEIFYTAITRAKEKLKIYWTKEKQEEMINILSERKERIDVNKLIENSHKE